MDGKGRIAVYTAIFGGVDSLNDPEFTHSDIDFFCFTDNPDLSSDIWKIVVEDGPFYPNHQKSAKFYKIFPNLFFKEYELSLWVDATYVIKADFRWIFEKHLKDDVFAAYNYRKDKSTYIDHDYKNNMIGEIKKFDKKKIDEQIAFYSLCDFKYNIYNFNMLLGGILFRRHNSPEYIYFSKIWWEQIINFTAQDQIGLAYSFSVSGMKYVEMPPLLENFIDHGWIKMLNLGRHSKSSLEWRRDTNSLSCFLNYLKYKNILGRVCIIGPYDELDELLIEYDKQLDYSKIYDILVLYKQSENFESILLNNVKNILIIPNCTEEILDRLKNFNCKIFLVDLKGDTAFVFKGQSVEIRKVQISYLLDLVEKKNIANRNVEKMLRENKIVQSLWIEKELPFYISMAINSFLMNGHSFHLYVYDEVEGVPDGVEIKDANDIIPKEKIFTGLSKYYGINNSYCFFSDLFRYSLLYKYGGWWVDSDMVCLKPFNFKDEYVFAKEGSSCINALIKCPPKSDLMLECVKKMEDLSDKIKWGYSSVYLTEQIKKLNLEKYTLSRNTFIPISVFCIDLFKEEYNLPDEECFGVHLFSSALSSRWSNCDFLKALNNKKSLLRVLVDKYHPDPNKVIEKMSELSVFDGFDLLSVRITFDKQSTSGNVLCFVDENKDPIYYIWFNNGDKYFTFRQGYFSKETNQWDVGEILYIGIFNNDNLSLFVHVIDGRRIFFEGGKLFDFPKLYKKFSVLGGDPRGKTENSSAKVEILYKWPKTV